MDKSFKPFTYFMLLLPIFASAIVGGLGNPLGAIAGGLFVWTFALTQNKWKIDDVLRVWPLHGICGAFLIDQYFKLIQRSMKVV